MCVADFQSFDPQKDIKRRLNITEIRNGVHFEFY